MKLTTPKVKVNYLVCTCCLTTLEASKKTKLSNKTVFTNRNIIFTNQRNYLLLSEHELVDVMDSYATAVNSNVDMVDGTIAAMDGVGKDEIGN